MSFAVGSRFKMSALGAARSPRRALKEGTIVGAGRHSCTVRVLFDGSKSAVSLHRDYIEEVPSDGKRAPHARAHVLQSGLLD
jgi:hypothetical protein